MLTARTRKIIEESDLGVMLRQEGRQEGHQEGLKEGRLKDARAMFAEGDSLTKIARVTKIPVKRLKKELQAQ